MVVIQIRYCAGFFFCTLDTHPTPMNLSLDDHIFYVYNTENIKNNTSTANNTQLFKKVFKKLLNVQLVFIAYC